ncbi:MAG: ABC transporter ATP-binding protein, partial [Clostridia bacterium]|nr:ABC transporter ATP-binding protein [Clostridia bacterium]
MPPRGPRAIAKPKNAKDTLRRLIRYLGRSRKQLILVACCILISTAASATGTFLLKPAVDGYLTPLVEQASQNLKVDLTPYLSFLMLLLAMYLAGAAAQFLSNRIMMMVSTGTLNHLRKEMFDHMEDLPIRYFDQRTHGEIMSRYTNDTDTLREFLSQAFPQAVSSALSILLSLAFMLNLNIWMTLLVLALTPLMFKITTTIGKKSGASFAAQQKAVGALNGYIEETIEGQRVVQVFCHEEKSIDEFTGKNEDVRVAGTRANTFASMLWPIMGNLGHAIYVLVALVGSIFIVNNAATLGTLIAFLPFTRQFSQPISNLSQQFSIIMQALAGAERIFELMDEPVEEDQGYVKLVRCRKDENGNIVETPERTGMWAWKHPHKADGTVTYTELRGDVVFEHVNFGYVPEKTVLHDVSLYAKPGQKIAFVGSTGAGKTTITNLINRFYDIQDGKIRYDGINIEKIKKDDLRRSLGMVLQDTHLFTGTVRDNIRYGKLDATDEEIRRAAKIANADFFIRHLPQGYETMLTGDGANLSQG